MEVSAPSVGGRPAGSRGEATLSWSRRDARDRHGANKDNGPKPGAHIRVDCMVIMFINR